MPSRRALVVSCSVALFALIVFAVVPAIAPRFASKAPVRFATGGPNASRVIVGAAEAFPVPSRTSAATVTPYLTSTPTFEPRHRPAATARGDGPIAVVELNVTMSVDHVTATTGDVLTYDVLAKNTGDKTFQGALTTNLHTPSGTLRCDMESLLEVCTTQGDYDGSSTDPNAPHTNPTGTTKIVTIEPGRTVNLYTLRVQVATTAGAILHNHAHVDGFGSITALANDITTKSVHLLGHVLAPDVLVR